jgi:hypothetical protein
MLLLGIGRSNFCYIKREGMIEGIQKLISQEKDELRGKKKNPNKGPLWSKDVSGQQSSNFSCVTFCVTLSKLLEYLFLPL